MSHHISPREYIERIYAEIQDSQKSRIWKDSVNMLSTVSESVFSRSAHFILELLQNAEDSGSKTSSPRGRIEFIISDKRIRVSHNGTPFSEANCDAICGVRSTKKPEKGTLGFLGIGFKSVFKITDSPHIYSGGFQFRFDKYAHASPATVPWQIMPLWVDTPIESVDRNLTSFVLPFRTPELFEQTRAELQRLDVHVFLFLKWLKELRIIDETAGKTTVIKNLHERDGIISIRKDKDTQRFIAFRQSSAVPAEVSSDPILEFYKRQNVKRREIVIAFAVDEHRHLQRIEDASALGSVSSFLPLVEERSGAPFLIQADFLVQPGREAIQYEAAWNHWLVREASELAKRAIKRFKLDAAWRQQFLPLFNFASYEGQAAFDRLFSPELKEPLITFLQESDVIATASGSHVRPSRAVVAGEGLGGLIADDDLKLIFTTDGDFHLIHPDLQLDSLPEEILNDLQHIEIGEIARNKELLIKKSHAQGFSKWFATLFRAMAESRQQFKSVRSGVRWVDDPIFVLTETKEVLPASQVYMRKIPADVLALKSRFPDVAKLLQSYKLIHPCLDLDELEEFFVNRTHLHTIDYDSVCRKVFLPKIETTSPAPTKEELIAYTRLLQKGPSISGPIWVVTDQGDVKPSDKIFLGTKYSPDEDWQATRQYSPQIDFVGAEYLHGVPAGELSKWKQFFVSVGAKQTGGNNHVEMFAMSFVEAKLQRELKAFVPKNRQQVGYDREARRQTDNALVKIEIKGQKADQPVLLVDNEHKAADAARNNGEQFWVCVVSGIPETPQLWVVEDALTAGAFDTLKIDIGQWKTHGRRIN